MWQLLLSLPIVFYASTIFFTGAVAALRARTLDMMVLIAAATGVGFTYSAAVTFGVSGDTFYDAAAMLATFVLLGHWFEGDRPRASAATAAAASCREDHVPLPARRERAHSPSGERRRCWPRPPGADEAAFRHSAPGALTWVMPARGQVGFALGRVVARPPGRMIDTGPSG